MDNNCAYCKKPFVKKRKNHKFCKDGCRAMFHNVKNGNKMTQKILDNKNLPKMVDVLNPSLKATEAKKDTHVQVQNPRYTIEHLTSHLEYLQNQLFSAENGSYFFSTVSMGAIGAGLGAASSKPKTILKDKNGKVIRRNSTKETDKGAVILGGVIGGLLGHFIDKNRKKADIIHLKREIQATKTRIDKAKSYDKWISKVLNKLQLDRNSNKTNPTLDLPKGVVTGEQIANMDFKFYQMKQSFWGLLWGAKIADPFYAIAYGLPSQGKSTLAISFANYFMDKHGKTLYLASEQGVAMSLQNIIKKTNGLNIHLDGSPKDKTIEQHINDINKYNYKLVVIDSATHMRYSHDDIEEMRKATPGTSYLVILQAIKDGDFKGDNQWAHNCDIMVKVHDRKAFTTKSRFLEAKADWYEVPAHR